MIHLERIEESLSRQIERRKTSLNECPRGCSVLVPLDPCCDPCTYFRVGEIVKKIAGSGVGHVFTITDVGRSAHQGCIKGVPPYYHSLDKIHTYASCVGKVHDQNDITYWGL